MSIADSLTQQISIAIKTAYPDLEVPSEEIQLDHPTAKDHGDYATNIALKLAKQLGENPRIVAEKIVERLQSQLRTSEKLTGATAKEESGFINFSLSSAALAQELAKILTAGDGYGSSEVGRGKTVVIDYSAPNIAKQFGIGHLRSTVIGQALYNLYKFQGYRVIGDNHLGDWGTQFGKLLYMIDREKPTNLDLATLEALYIRFHDEAANNPKLEVEGRAWFKKLESGDSTARHLWEDCVAISLAEFNRIYTLLGVKIDFAYGESFYEDKMAAVIAEAKAKRLAVESEGAWVIPLDGVKAPLILVKSDGTTTYGTRDLATLKYRRKEWDPDLVIYEVGSEQDLHFRQVFAAARLLGYIRPETLLVHTKHGLYRWEHGKMRTRTGETVKLESILQEAIDRAAKLGNQDTASAVGIGAVRYFDLKHQPQSDIIFDWETMFQLEGDSGPYLQYTHARAKSVLRKAGHQETQGTGSGAQDWIGEKGGKSNSRLQLPASNSVGHYSTLVSGSLTPEELSLLRYLYRFPEAVAAAAQSFSPNLVASYLSKLAKRFNNFYDKDKIITSSSESTSPPVDQNFRLALTAGTAQILKNGLTLLGIQPLEKM